MKFLVFNTPNTLNYGSMMMAQNLFTYMGSVIPDGRLNLLVVTTKGDETRDRLVRALSGESNEVSLHVIHPRDLVIGGRLRRNLAKLTGVGFRRRLSKEVDSVNGVVVLGGDDFTEDYGFVRPVVQLATLGRFADLGKPVVLSGHSVGPFSSWREPIIRYLLRKMTLIVARDPISHRYLKRDLRLANVALGADLAFMPLADEHRYSSLELPWGSQPYMTVVPSEILWRYAQTRDRKAYIDMLVRLCKAVLDKTPRLALLILPHVVTNDESDDRLAGESLRSGLLAAGIEESRLSLESRQLLPGEARAMLARSQLVVTGRMHAAISALVSGVPAVSLAYSTKYWGIIGDYLGLKHWIVDVRYNSWAEVEEKVFRTVLTILAEREEVTKLVRARTCGMQRRALDTVRMTVEALMQRGSEAEREREVGFNK